MTDVLILRKPNDDHAYITGPAGGPPPAKARDLLKRTYEAVWLPTEKRWRLTLPDADSFVAHARHLGMNVEHRDIAGGIQTATGDLAVGLRECAECGHPYSHDYRDGGACRACGEPLTLMAPIQPTTTARRQEATCRACGDLVYPGRDRYCRCGQPTPPPVKATRVALPRDPQVREFFMETLKDAAEQAEHVKGSPTTVNLAAAISDSVWRDMFGMRAPKRHQEAQQQ